MTNAHEVALGQSINDPERFWGEAAQDIEWIRRWDRVLDDSNPPFYRWFTGGRLNTCYNAVDHHVATGRGDQPALIYDSPVTGTIRTYTYRQLRDEVAAFAGRSRPRRGKRGPGHCLHAHDSRSGHRHAGLRAHRCRALGGVRRVRRQGAGHAHRRCQAQVSRVGLVRDRGSAGHPL
jgi:hypothetical protein